MENKIDDSNLEILYRDAANQIMQNLSKAESAIVEFSKSQSGQMMGNFEKRLEIAIEKSGLIGALEHHVVTDNQVIPRDVEYTIRSGSEDTTTVRLWLYRVQGRGIPVKGSTDASSALIESLESDFAFLQNHRAAYNSLLSEWLTLQRNYVEEDKARENARRIIGNF